MQGGPPPRETLYLLWFPLVKIGYIGVDIFIFLSGFGIAYSIFKKPDILLFYKKRLFRLLPALPIAIAYLCTFQINNFAKIIGCLSFLNWWLYNNVELHNFGYFWYIPTILLLYFLSPIFYPLVDKLQSSTKKFCLFITITYILTIPLMTADYCRLLISFSRIPIYLFGIYYGIKYCKNELLSKKSQIFFYIMGIISFILLIFICLFKGNIKEICGLLRYPGFFIAPALIFLISSISHLIKNSFLYKFVTYIGTSTLEIYLIDALILCLLPNQIKEIYFILRITISISLGILYNRLFNILKNLIKKLFYRLYP